MEQSAMVAAGTAMASTTLEGLMDSSVRVPTQFDFVAEDSLYHGSQWQTLNPGFWKIENNALRRRLTNYGDRARRTGFPYHAETHSFEFKTEYDPSLPTAVIYQPNWFLKGDYSVRATFTFRGHRPEPGEKDRPEWHMFQPGYGMFGIAIGSKSVFESYGKITNAFQFGWTDANQLRLFRPGNPDRGRQSGNQPWKDQGIAKETFELKEGDRCTLLIRVKTVDEKNSAVTVSITKGDHTVSLNQTMPRKKVEGFTGIAARGLIDFEVNSFEVVPERNEPRIVGVADCLACYPLGDTLKKVEGQWKVRFVGMFASDGQQVEIRVADSETPVGGWKQVPVGGVATIVSNEWRRNTATIEVTLPRNPADTDLYYTIWKDGVDVTADARIGTAACGAGTGLVGDVPTQGDYVGRLPRLVAPYKLCGLSCHAVTSGLQQRTADGWKMSGGRDIWQFRDQPSVESYKHLEDYNFQIMVWEDDVWYMELVMYPPSTDDAYKIVKLSICGPTSRWQMMRHWNVINPGDHDYGMDDVKGPEQIAIRKTEGLGQDPAYMRRNFQIVHHLITGDEEVDPYENPKKWRAWKMPNRDFTFVVLDSRLWRSSQDVDVWDDQGWESFKSLYDRTDPTRSLLGEEQFGWLQELLSTDSSPLICLTGLNGLHTVWAGAKSGKTDSGNHPKNFSQRDRVTADYAGWVKAGADRVIELLGSRTGLVSVYGDVHNGCIMKNTKHRVIECSFGPIGRTGGRALIPGFGPKMKDVDEREVEVYSLYHRSYKDAEQNAHEKSDPIYWNFLEIELDPTRSDPDIQFRVRNLIDPPTAKPRGGGELVTSASQTGREPVSFLKSFKTLANADVFVTYTNGKSIRGTRSQSNGTVEAIQLPDVDPGTQLLINVFDGQKSESRVLTTEKPM